MKNGENRQKIVLLPSKMVLPPSKMVLPQAMAWVQYWFRVLSLKSKKNCGDISQVSPAFCMYAEWLIWVGIQRGCHHSRASHSRCPGCRIQLQCHHSRASFSQVLRHPTTVFTTPKLQGILLQLSTVEDLSGALAFNYSDHYSWQGAPQWSL